ncbi:hypothetical protein TWF481_006543 [Arthrobotrys musiformis]|uniref:CFEM domain-containing protein n=1 Tax=Arthrobotrys musiformis TaxID=47236 RepID=A0AAV9W8U4_9PEZI
MRFVSRLNISLFVLKVASARGLVLARAEPPACIQACLPPAIGATGCQLQPVDASCICDSQAFYESLLPCVLINCGYVDVSALLSYGLEFCNRAGVNSAQRLGLGFGKSASGGGGDGDDGTSVSTSTAPVEPTPAPDLEPTPSAALVQTVVPSISAVTTTESPPISESTLTVEPTSQTENPVLVLVEPTTLVVVSTTSPTQGEETALSISEPSVSSTQIKPSESPRPDSLTPEQSIRPATSSGLFTVESRSKVEDSNTELVVIQTIDSTSRNTRSPATTALRSTSAPPTPTADEPSSASASVKQKHVGVWLF